MNSFHEKIYELRKQHNLTQEDVADRLGVSRQTISNWENGTAQPTIDKAIDIARLYNSSLDSLVSNSPSNNISLPADILNKKVTLYFDQDNDTYLDDNFSINGIITKIAQASLRIETSHKDKHMERIIATQDICAIELEDN